MVSKNKAEKSNEYLNTEKQQSKYFNLSKELVKLFNNDFCEEKKSLFNVFLSCKTDKGSRNLLNSVRFTIISIK